MPLDDFEIITNPDELKQLDFASMAQDAPHGYFVMGDWEYPEHLHSKHSDLPLIADLEDICYDNLSPYSRQMLHKAYPSINAKKYKAKKLICSFHGKKKHLTHYLNAQMYLKHGLKLTNVHYAIRFRQRAFVKEYIKTCTTLRQKSKGPFFKSVYKLMANSVGLTLCVNK